MSQPALDSLQGQLSTALTKAKEEEEACRSAMEAAKARYLDAKETTKKLVRTIQAYEGRDNGGIRKEDVRPLVIALLKRGPLPEDKLSTEVTRVLRERSLPTAGLALVLRSLRSEYANEEGVWRLNGSPAPQA